ncbi:MAG: hypothetical protein ACKVQS_13160 [Fimbriimonadaceae bacterium]
MKKFSCILAIFVASLSPLANANSPFSFTQSPNLAAASPGNISDVYSSNGVGGLGFSSADDFSLAAIPGSTYEITSLTFYGFGFNGAGGNPSTFLSNLEINIFNNSGTTPSTILHTLSLSPSNAIVTNTFNSTIAGFSSYKTTIDLTSAPLYMGTGGTYWLNIGGKGTSGSSYIWNYSTINSGNAFIQATTGGWSNWIAQPGAGLAFSISGNVIESVPEPATIAIAMCIIPALRKRKNRTAKI